MLNRNGTVKIIDFGLARSTDMKWIQPGYEQMTANVTTPLYKAPELYFGQKVYSEKIDIWACGLLFFELLT
jgi:cyclin-dependent kinase 7